MSILIILFGSDKYNASVVVGYTSGGKLVFYDMIDLNPANFIIKNRNKISAEEHGKFENQSDNQNPMRLSTDEDSISQNDNAVNTYSMQEDESRYMAENKQSKIYDYSKSFVEQVDDYKRGVFPKNDTLIVGSTPKIWQDVGFNALPVTIDQTHTDFALNGTKDSDHYIGELLFKDLPNAIQNPIAIIQSQSMPSRTVVILKLQHGGKNIITPVEVDGIGTSDNVNIDSNVITSVFGKTNALKQMKSAIENTVNGKTELFYWNKKEAVSLLQARGLQLPNSLPRDGFTHSIRENGSKINTKFKNVTETQQFKRWFGKSKVVNADGTPKIVYHGTSEDFNVFDITKSRSYDETLNYDLPGFYFSESKEESGSYGGKMGAYYISIKNQYKGNTYTLAKRLGSFRKAYDYLVGKGYDGIIVDELGEGYNEYIVFKPEQIKSATDNIGTFDGNNPDIRYMIEVDEDSSKENFGTYDSVKAKEIDKRDRRIKELETQLENAHMQLLYNEGKGIDTDATLKISEEIIKNYSSDISKVKLHRDITAFFRSGLF